MFWYPLYLFLNLLLWQVLIAKPLLYGLNTDPYESDYFWPRPPYCLRFDWDFEISRRTNFADILLAMT